MESKCEYDECHISKVGPSAVEYVRLHSSRVDFMLGTVELDCICILYDVPTESKNKTFVEFVGPFSHTKYKRVLEFSYFKENLRTIRCSGCAVQGC